MKKEKGPSKAITVYYKIGSFGEYIVRQFNKWYYSRKENSIRVIRFIGETEDDTVYTTGHVRQPFSKGLWMTLYKLLKKYNEDNKD